ncbi:unnamed protein product [Moneuplotes crassus]|uniref:Uncharacterized protein n=1 Tax=Euplotes crassus TaxID=5936 RepID=A0AAD2DAQ1_EUPCR|nr:unnamed protein product [Moneuplotes crassus]
MGLLKDLDRLNKSGTIFPRKKESTSFNRLEITDKHKREVDHSREQEMNWFKVDTELIKKRLVHGVVGLQKK